MLIQSLIAKAFHEVYKVVDLIDSQLTPRPPLEITVPTPISVSNLARVIKTMTDTLAQTNPDEEVIINLPPHVRSPEIIKGVQAHTEQSDSVKIIAIIRRPDSDALRFKLAEHNGHDGNGKNSPS